MVSAACAESCSDTADIVCIESTITLLACLSSSILDESLETLSRTVYVLVLNIIKAFGCILSRRLFSINSVYHSVDN